MGMRVGVRGRVGPKICRLRLYRLTEKNKKNKIENSRLLKKTIRLFIINHYRNSRNRLEFIRN